MLESWNNGILGFGLRPAEITRRPVSPAGRKLTWRGYCNVGLMDKVVLTIKNKRAISFKNHHSNIPWLRLKLRLK